MLNRTLKSVLRPSLFEASSDLSARRFKYDNPKLHNLKYPNAAKERRRLKREMKSDENKTPLEMGETIPPFYIAPRYKLMFKMIQDNKNSRRLQRKPIP